MNTEGQEHIVTDTDLSMVAVHSALDVTKLIDDAIDRKKALIQKAAFPSDKYNMVLIASVSAEDTHELQSNFIFCQLASSKPKADEVISSPDSNYNVVSRTLKYLQKNLIKNLLKTEYPGQDNTFNYLVFPELSKFDRLSAHMVGYIVPNQDDYAFNMKSIDFLTAIRTTKSLPVAKAEPLKVKRVVDAPNPFKSEDEKVIPKTEEKPKNKEKMTERRYSGTDKAVHFQKDSAPMMKELHKEKYEDDDSIFDKIPMLQGLRQDKKQKKKPLIHNKFNDAAQAAPGSCLDFWTHNIDFHNHGDVELIKRLEAASKNVTTMAKRVIQTDCCKKMEAFISNGFSPTFFDKQGYVGKGTGVSKGQKAGRESSPKGQNETRSLTDMLDLM